MLWHQRQHNISKMMKTEMHIHVYTHSTHSHTATIAQRYQRGVNSSGTYTNITPGRIQSMSVAFVVYMRYIVYLCSAIQITFSRKEFHCLLPMFAEYECGYDHMRVWSVCVCVCALARVCMYKCCDSVLCTAQTNGLFHSNSCRKRESVCKQQQPAMFLCPAFRG